MQNLLKIIIQYNEHLKYNGNILMELFNNLFFKKVNFLIKWRLNGSQEGWRISIWGGRWTRGIPKIKTVCDFVGS